LALVGKRAGILPCGLRGLHLGIDLRDLRGEGVDLADRL
jgi:hypothetical protein